MDDHIRKIVGLDLIRGGRGDISPEAWNVLEELNRRSSQREKARFIDELMNSLVEGVLDKLGVKKKPEA